MRASSSVSRSALVISALVLANCSGGGGSPPGGNGPTAPNVVFTIPGPYSQTYTPAGGTAFTATQVKLTYIGAPGQPSGLLYESLQIDTTFTQDISTALPAPGAPLQNGNQLGVFVGLDSDANPLTGTTGIGCTNFPGLTSSGSDFFIDSGFFAGRLPNGNYTLLETTARTGKAPSGDVKVSVSGHTLTEVVDLPALAIYNTVPKIGVVLTVMNGLAQQYTEGTPTGTQPIGQCIPAQGEFVTG